MTNLQRKPLELYIHVPFCARKCLYCDFLSFRRWRLSMRLIPNN